VVISVYTQSLLQVYNKRSSHNLGHIYFLPDLFMLVELGLSV